MINQRSNDPPLRKKISIKTEIADGSDDYESVPEFYEFVDDYFECRYRRRRLGFKNIGNTCYMNAILQALGCIQPFVGSILHFAGDQNDNASLTYALHSLFKRSDPDSVQDVIQSFSRTKPNFICLKQQDAHEALRILLDTVHEENRIIIPCCYDPIERLFDQASTQPPSPRSQNISVSSQSSLSCRSETENENRTNECKSVEVDKSDQEDTFKFSSFISENFEGATESIVTCYRCGQKSRSNEKFSDISVSLLDLSRKQCLPQLPEINRIQLSDGVKSLSCGFDGENNIGSGTQRCEGKIAIESAAQCGERNFKKISSISRNAALVLGTQAVSLESCLSHFFRTEFLSGDDQYYCDTCRSKTDACRESSIIYAPDVLCIHIKRFTSGAWLSRKLYNRLIFPLMSLDISPYACEKMDKTVPLNGHLYDLVSVVEHSGFLSSGHYTAYCLDEAVNRWKHFDDQSVREVSAKQVASSSPYLLFYKRRILPIPMALLSLPPTLLCKKCSDGKVVYLSKSWVVRLLTSRSPGPINNFHIVCTHGYLKPGIDLLKAAHHMLVRVPEEIYQYLLQIYGTGDDAVENFKVRPLKNLKKCETCANEAQKRHSKRLLESGDIISLYDDSNVVVGNEAEKYVIDSTWVEEWNRFIKAGLNEDCNFPTLPPGEINNAQLLGADGKLKPKLSALQDYKTVPKSIFDYFVSIYGGGPAIALQ